MKRTFLMALAIASLGLVAAQPALADHDNGTLVKTRDFVTVGPNDTNRADGRGVVGGGLPWTLADGKARLRADGRLDVRVEGLVFDPAFVPAPRGGTNPLAQFGYLVSCVTPGGVVNSALALAPASVPGGDSRIRTTVMLPQSGCEDPVVYVTSPTGAWFAKTVADDEDDD